MQIDRQSRRSDAGRSAQGELWMPRLPHSPPDSHDAVESRGEEALSTSVTTQQAEPQKRRIVEVILAPLRIRDYRLLLGGQVISNLGDNFFFVALPWLVLTRGGGAEQLGFLLAAFGIARIAFTLWGGILSDRLGPRRVMLIADIGRAVITGILTWLVLWQPNPPFWQLCVLAIPLGALTGVFQPASFSIVPDLLPDEVLPAGNALSTSTRQLASMIGPSLAGVVIGALQVGAALAYDAGSFVVSAVSLGLMRYKDSHIQAPGRATTGSTLERASTDAAASQTGARRDDPLSETAGYDDDDKSKQLTLWQLVRSSQVFQVALAVVLLTGLTFDGMLVVALPALTRGPFAGGPSGYGVLLAAFAAGMLIGAAGSTLLGSLRQSARVALLLVIVEAGAFAAVPFLGGIVGAVLALALAGAANGMASMLFLTLVQRQLPQHLRGRIMSALLLANDGLFPVSVALAGVVTTRWGPAAMFPLGAFAILVAALFGLSQSDIRRLSVKVERDPRVKKSGTATPVAQKVSAPASSPPSRPPNKAIVNVALSVIATAIVLLLCVQGLGALPALGPTFNPDTGAWTMAIDAKNPTNTSLRLAGLQGPVQVKFEANGTPHVIATNDHDLFLAMGYLHAKFRLLQMDLMRRQGESKLSAIAGKAALPSDEFEYQLGLTRTAQAEWDQMRPGDETREALVAYAQGVNAIITDETASGHLPALFKLLGYQPERWTPLDSLVIQGVMTQSLSLSDTPLHYSYLVKSLGMERTMAWFPQNALNEQRPWDPGPYQQLAPAPLPTIQGTQTGQTAQSTQSGHVTQQIGDATLQAASSIISMLSQLPPTAIHTFPNSNAWAVDGTMTASGKPLMAGDPHLEETLPSTWYQIDAWSPNYQFSGVSIPGLPAILIGHNAHISWTLTNGQNQQSLYYAEQTDAAHPGQYFWNGSWHQLQKLQYSIPVKGESPHSLTVELTAQGPIVTRFGLTMALWWAGAVPSHDLQAMLGVMRASNFGEFRSALKNWGAPSQTVVYADDQGNIGEQSAGYYPLVKSGQPWLPLPGTGESDVVGTIPFEALPTLFNPPTHFVFAANQRPVDASYPYFIGTPLDGWDQGYRADQIYHHLSGAQHLTVQDMQNLQLDTHDYMAQQFVPPLLDALANAKLTPQEQQAADLMRKWDYNMNIESPAATIWNRFLHHYVYDAVHPWWDFYHVPENQDPKGLRYTPDGGSSAFQALGQNLLYWDQVEPNNPIFSLPNGTHRSASDVLRESFSHTVDALSKRFGPDPNQWTWGKWNQHEIPSVLPIDSLGYGPYPHGGDNRVINSEDITGRVQKIATAGPSWRFIMDWSTGQGEGVYPGGESENPLSPWYTNQISAWWNGHYFPMLTHDQVSAQSTVGTWSFLPAAS